MLLVMSALSCVILLGLLRLCHLTHSITSPLRTYRTLLSLDFFLSVDRGLVSSADSFPPLTFCTSFALSDTHTLSPSFRTQLPRPHRSFLRASLFSLSWELCYFVLRRSS